MKNRCHHPSLFALGIASLFTAGFGLTLAACGWGKPACTIVDSLSDACTVVRYLGPDGKPHEVRVTSDELSTFALGVAASANRLDAGR